MLKKIEIELIVCSENVKNVDKKNEINVFFVIKFSPRGAKTYSIDCFVIKIKFTQDLYKGLDFSGLSVKIEIAFAP